MSSSITGARMSDHPIVRRMGEQLEGWPVGLWIVFLCALSAALVVPRKVEPDSVPPPVIDRPEQRRTFEAERQRFELGRAGLPIEVRAVGEALRRVGRAAFEGSETTSQNRKQLHRLLDVALERHGPERLLELRALQAELFAQAISQRSGDEPTSEQRELGGSLLAIGVGRGWFEPAPLGADDKELRTLFRIYWTDTLGLTQGQPFAPTLNEWRAYYRFLLGRPIGEAPDADGDLQRKLGYVAALAKHDQDYPRHLARGILLYQRGAPAESAGELRMHLEISPDGPWTLRAQNYLAACGAQLVE